MSQQTLCHFFSDWTSTFVLQATFFIPYLMQRLNAEQVLSWWLVQLVSEHHHITIWWHCFRTSPLSLPLSSWSPPSPSDDSCFRMGTQRYTSQLPWVEESWQRYCSNLAATRSLRTSRGRPAWRSAGGRTSWTSSTSCRIHHPFLARRIGRTRFDMFSQSLPS